MIEQELAAIEARHAAINTAYPDEGADAALASADDVPALVAEVRRLRALMAEWAAEATAAERAHYATPQPHTTATDRLMQEAIGGPHVFETRTCVWCEKRWITGHLPWCSECAP